MTLLITLILLLSTVDKTDKCTTSNCGARIDHAVLT